MHLVLARKGISAEALSKIKLKETDTGYPKKESQLSINGTSCCFLMKRTRS